MPVLEASAGADIQAAPPTNLLSLLVIDDERSIRDACCEIAHSLGYEVSTAESAERAFRVLGEKAHDIALLDLRLPGASGMEVLHRMRESNPEMVIVVMTGYATVPSAVEAMRLGAYDYMTKPFSIEDLRNKLEEEREPTHAGAVQIQARIRIDHRSISGNGTSVPNDCKSSAEHASGADPG